MSSVVSSLPIWQPHTLDTECTGIPFPRGWGQVKGCDCRFERVGSTDEEMGSADEGVGPADEGVGPADEGEGPISEKAGPALEELCRSTMSSYTGEWS